MTARREFTETAISTALPSRLDPQVLIDSAAEGIVAIGLDGQIQMINRYGSEHLGAPRHELTGKDFHALVHPHCATSECAMIVALTLGRDCRTLRDQFATAERGVFPVEYSLSLATGEAVSWSGILTFVDVSARESLERQLEECHRIAALGQAVATTAHEFNNVLMSIQPVVDVLKRQAASDSHLLRAVNHINDAVRRGKRITEEILRFTRPARPLIEPFGIRDWLERLEIELREVLSPHQIRMGVPAEDFKIDGDRELLTQVVMIIAFNARDAMPQHGTFTMTVGDLPPSVIAEKLPPWFVIISLSDTGCGIASDDLRRIFEPLFSTKRAGTGLGLSAARQIVRKHGGEIFVESTFGRGTTFYLALPRVPTISGPGWMASRRGSKKISPTAAAP